MLLCLDIGNSQIYGGVFAAEKLLCEFRKSTHPLGTADEMGLFIHAVLRARGVDPKAVTRIAICSVVPPALPALCETCEKYFGMNPFVLQAGVKTGLRVKYRNPLEVGSDRIAGAIAALERHPAQDSIVVDCGTATTFDVVTASGEYLGGSILPGLAISAETLASRTAKLPRVDISRPAVAIGRSTSESIQAGLFYGHLGAIRNLITEISREAFSGARPRVIGTGGLAGLFANDGVFDEIVPELVLLGLRKAEFLNREGAEPVR